MCVFIPQLDSLMALGRFLSSDTASSLTYKFHSTVLCEQQIVISRNIIFFAPEIMYFRYLEKYPLNQSLPKNIFHFENRSTGKQQTNSLLRYNVLVRPTRKLVICFIKNGYLQDKSIS